MEGFTLARLKELLEARVAKAPSIKELAPTKQDVMRRLGSLCGVGPLDDDDAVLKYALSCCPVDAARNLCLRVRPPRLYACAVGNGSF